MPHTPGYFKRITHIFTELKAEFGSLQSFLASFLSVPEGRTAMKEITSEIIHEMAKESKLLVHHIGTQAIREYIEGAKAHIQRQLVSVGGVYGSDPPPEYEVPFQQLTEVKAVTIPRLRYTLQSFFSLPVSGKKATLIKRLVDHLLGAHNHTY